MSTAELVAIRKLTASLSTQIVECLAVCLELAEQEKFEELKQHQHKMDELRCLLRAVKAVVNPAYKSVIDQLNVEKKSATLQ